MMKDKINTWFRMLTGLIIFSVSNAFHATWRGSDLGFESIRPSCPAALR